MAAWVSVRSTNCGSAFCLISTADSESSLRRKVDLIYGTTTNHKVRLQVKAPHSDCTFSLMVENGQFAMMHPKDREKSNFRCFGN